MKDISMILIIIFATISSGKNPPVYRGIHSEIIYTIYNLIIIPEGSKQI